MGDRLQRREMRRENRLRRFKKITKRLGLTRSALDKHYVPLQEAYASYKTHKEDLNRVSVFLDAAKELGLTAVNLTREQFEELRETAAGEGWTVATGRKLRQIQNVLFASETRKGKGDHANPDLEIRDRYRAESPDDRQGLVDPDDPPLRLTDDDVGLYNVVVTQPWLGPRPVSEIRSRPNENVPQINLLFPNGQRYLFPEKLTNPTEEIRYNLPEPVIIYMTTVGEEMIRQRFPDHPDIAEACVQRFRRMNFHFKPSSQRPIQALYDASRANKKKVCLEDVEAALAFYQYHVEDTGYGKATYNHLKKFKLHKVARPTFKYQISDSGRIRDEKGRRLPITVHGPGSKRTTTVKSDPFKGKDVQRFQWTNSFHYVGLDDHGRFVYECFQDRYAVTVDQIRNLRSRELDMMTTRENAIRASQDIWDRRLLAGQADPGLDDDVDFH